MCRFRRRARHGRAASRHPDHTGGSARLDPGPGWRNGRRIRLKIGRPQGHGSSNLPPGTRPALAAGDLRPPSRPSSRSGPPTPRSCPRSALLARTSGRGARAGPATKPHAARRCPGMPATAPGRLPFGHELAPDPVDSGRRGDSRRDRGVRCLAHQPAAPPRPLTDTTREPAWAAVHDAIAAMPGGPSGYASTTLTASWRTRRPSILRHGGTRRGGKRSRQPDRRRSVRWTPWRRS